MTFRDYFSSLRFVGTRQSLRAVPIEFDLIDEGAFHVVRAPRPSRLSSPVGKILELGGASAFSLPLRQPRILAASWSRAFEIEFRPAHVVVQ